MSRIVAFVIISILMMPIMPANFSSPLMSIPNPTKFTYLTTGGPETGDPAWAYDTASAELIFNAYQTLCFFNRTSYDSYVPMLADWWPGIGENPGNAITPIYPGDPAYAALNPEPPAGTEETWVFHVRTGMPWQTFAYNPDTQGFENYNYGTVTPFDVEYSIERGMLMDHAGGPQWMLFDPLTGHHSIREWNATDPAERTAAGHVVDDAIQSNSTYVWFNLVKPYVPFQQILSQTWAAIIPHQYAIDNGCWNGSWHYGGDYQSWIAYHDPAAPGPLGHKMLGCGPYYLDYIAADGSNHRLKKFDNYWGGWSGNYVDTVAHEVVLDWALRKPRFFSNDPNTQADMVTVLRADINDPDLLNQIAANNVRCIKDLSTIQADCVLFAYNYTASSQITPGNGIGTGTAGVYATKTDLLSDRYLRLALVYAYNATTFITDSYKGEGVPLHDCVINGIPYSNVTKQTAMVRSKDMEKVVYNLKMAWGGIDYHNGTIVPGEVWNKGFQATLVHSPATTMRRVPGTIIKTTIETELPAYLIAHGISRPATAVDSVVQVGQPWGTFITNMYSGFLPTYVVGWWGGDFPDPHDWVRPFMSLYGDWSRFQQVHYGDGIMDWHPAGGYGTGPTNGFPYANYKGEKVTGINSTYVQHLIETGIATPPGPLREQLYNELEDIYYAEAASIMTMQPTARHYERVWVQGWLYNAIYPGLLFYGRELGVDMAETLWKGTPSDDVAITSVVPSQTVVAEGCSVSISVAAKNQGINMETFNVTAYADTTAIETKEVTLASGDLAQLVFAWNTSGFSLGNYAISAYAWPVPGESQTANNLFSDGVVQIIPVHDVAVTNVASSQTVVARGSLLDINVTAANLGYSSECFNVTVYANGTCVGSQNITLATGSSATVFFAWDTTDVALGSYVLSAYAWPVPGETRTDDNLYSDGVVRIILPVHDVAVTGVSPSRGVVGQGAPLDINVAVANLGVFAETFNVTVYANSSYIDSRNVTLAAGGSETIIFAWDTTDVALGSYVLSAYAWPVPGETRTDDNLYSDGVVRIILPVHDVAITAVVPSPAVVGKGDPVSISVSVQNQGTYTETFNVTVYAGTTTVDTMQISLANGDSTTLAFIWNTGDVAVGEYEVRAEASAVPGETDTADNTLIDGTVVIWTPEIHVFPGNCTFDALTSPVGTEFNVTVKVNNVTDMKTWNVKMSFDDSIINVTRWYEPTWDHTYVFYGKATLPVPTPPKVYYNPAGWCGVGVALFPAPDVGGGFTGSGLLCMITFKIMAIPPLNHTCSCVLNVTHVGDTFWIKSGESYKRQYGEYENGYYELGLSGPSFHDVGITDVRVSPDFVYAGENDVTICVDVWNSGYFPETFNVTVYADANSTVIGDEITISVQSLSFQSQGFVTLTFTWNTTGVPPSNYTISAVASNVPEEEDLTNNLFVDGEVGIFASVPCYDVNVTCPTTVTVNPSIFTYDPTYQARLINIGNVSIVSTGFEGALRVLGSSNGTIRLCVDQPNVDVYNFFLPLNGGVQVPLWLMFQPETHWETYNGDFTLELTVCGTHRRQLHIVGISIIVCQNGAYIVNNETVTFTWTLSGGSLVYLEAEANLPPGWTYSVDPAVGELFETPHVVTVNITAPPDASEGDMGYVTLRAYKNATGVMFWQFIYFASTDNKPPTIEAVQSPTLTLAGDLVFSATVRDASGISNVQFWYSVNDGPWNNEDMQWSSGDTFNSTRYTSTVPHVPDNSTIKYYVVAADWLGNQTQSDVQTFVVKYDLAVTEVKTSKAIVGKGFSTRVEVTVANEGTLASPSVKIAVYANKTLIYLQTLQLLAEGATATLTFDWNTTGVSKGNYVIAAFIMPVLDETRTENNANASVVAVTIPGDVTGEGSCDMQDISIMIDWFMTTPPKWNPNCDVNNDMSIDMADISIAIDHFMQS